VQISLYTDITYPYYCIFWHVYSLTLPIPVAARSKTWGCGSWLAGVVGLNSAAVMDTCLFWVLYALSGRGLCVGLIVRPEDSGGVSCFYVRSWSLENVEALAHWGLLPHWKKKITLHCHTAFVVFGSLDLVALLWGAQWFRTGWLEISCGYRYFCTQQQS
jgi:hypothetical protein